MISSTTCSLSSSGPTSIPDGRGHQRHNAGGHVQNYIEQQQQSSNDQSHSISSSLWSDLDGLAPEIQKKRILAWSAEEIRGIYKLFSLEQQKAFIALFPTVKLAEEKGGIKILSDDLVHKKFLAIMKKLVQRTLKKQSPLSSTMTRTDASMDPSLSQKAEPMQPQKVAHVSLSEQKAHCGASSSLDEKSSLPAMQPPSLCKEALARASTIKQPPVLCGRSKKNGTTISDLSGNDKTPLWLQQKLQEKK